MSTIPAHPKIYHITPIENLAPIVRSGFLYSDSIMAIRGKPVDIGIEPLKARRMNWQIPGTSGRTIGQHVPFYFCPRSVMLYVLKKGNHPELKYRRGQGAILHLRADLRRVVSWAAQYGRNWCFSDCNASASYARFFSSWEDLRQIDWQAVASDDWRFPAMKERKQAEFLVLEEFPFHLIEHIGAANSTVADQAARIVGSTPLVRVEAGWYYW